MSDSSHTTRTEEPSPVSDERMDTASESFSSSQQGSSPSDCEERYNVASTEEPPVLRLANPLMCRSSKPSTHASINPPILISTLTLTEDHPLMTYSSPDSPTSTSNFPDLILHSHTKSQDKLKNESSDRSNSDYSGMLNLCSAEDEYFNRNILSGEICSLYGEEFSPHNGPQRNTSKNNLYFSDNLISPDSNTSLDGDELRNHSSKSFVKSNMQPDIVDSGTKHMTTTSDTMFSMTNQFHFENALQEKNKLKGTLSNQVGSRVDYQSTSRTMCQDRIILGLNVSEITAGVSKNEDDNFSIDVLQEDSQVLGMRKHSWSQSGSGSDSGSSVDSLCGCTIKSQEDEASLPIGNGEHMQMKNDSCEQIPEYSLNDERLDSRKWLKVILPSGERRSVDMKVIEPYKRVLSHGGYALSGRRDAIVVFSACFLPDSCRVDYNYVMDNLFLYVLTTMEQLVTDDYILIYLHGSASKRSMPTFHWLKKCYQLIDRRLRKSLKHLYLVHPTFWLKSVVFMTRPFISSKFFSKLTYVHTLEELSNFVPVEYAAIPERVRRFDSLRS